MGRSPITPPSYPEMKAKLLILTYLGLLCSTLNLAAIGQNYYPFEPPIDPFNSNAVVDLGAILNEAEAGQSGFVTMSDDGRFLLGDGTPVRFWTVNAGVPEDVDSMMSFLAKRGVNMVRWHTSVYNNNASSMSTVQQDRIDGLHRYTNAARQEGIYVKVSLYFVLGLRIQPEWGLDGWTQEWMDANPENADRGPQGLIFFDEDYQDAYKDWVTAIFSPANNFHPQRTPLADDPTVALVEIQNEENLFWWSSDPWRWPDESRAKAENAFYNWLIEKYGTEQAILDAWPGNFTRGFQGEVSNFDDFANQRVALAGPFHMTSGGATGATDRLRMEDQILFLLETQADWFTEAVSYMRNALGVKSLFSASNWKTADDEHLLDGEHWTYAQAGVIDVHNYFGAEERDDANNIFVSGGDRYLPIPTVVNPRRLPATYKHVRGRPAFLSESTWTQPFDYKSEAPPQIASYAALSDQDGWTWFSLGQEGWNTNMHRWPVALPSLAGIFPGSVFMYRRGDVAEAPVIVREGRTLESIARKENSIIQITPGWDSTQDPTGQFAYDPNTNQGLVDSLAFHVGKVEVDFENGDADFISPLIEEHIDYDNEMVTSVTGELSLDWGNGLFSVDTARSQGIAGYTDAAGRVELSDGNIRLTNEFGSVMVTSMDGLPINQSSQILIVTGTREYLTGHELEDVEFNVGTSRDPIIMMGKQVNAVGTLPWEIEQVDGTVDFPAIPTGEVESIQILDINGYATGETITPRARPSGIRVDLPAEAVMIVLNRTPLTDLTPVITTKALQNADHGEAYAGKIEAIAGDGELTFSSSNLPDGLSLAANGTVTGTPTTGGIYRFEVTVTDEDSDSSSQEILLQILPLDATSGVPSIFVEPGTFDLGEGWKWNAGLGYLWDGLYPFVYSFELANWFWVFDAGDGSVTEAGGYYLWDFTRPGWGWTNASTYPYYIALDGEASGSGVLLGPEG